MNNYPSQTLASVYSYPTVRQYPPQAYYYGFNEYPSSSLLSSYISPYHDRYSTSFKYYDDQEIYLQEYHHNHRSSYRQHSNHQSLNRAHNNSSQPQPKPSSIFNDNSVHSVASYQDRINYEAKTSMSENDSREHGILKRGVNRTSSGSIKPLTPTEFLAKTQTDVRQEYRKMPNPPAKDVHAAKDERNLDKSRYRDVLPGEATRVKLQPDGDEKHDFINANYVSGYDNQEKAYIFTQGPLQHTMKDFWRMVWQENIAIIVMTTNIREAGTVKCYPYWPTETRDVINTGLYQIQNENSEKTDSFIITTLTLRKKNSLETRIIYHAHYLKWPDHGVPSTTRDALLFLSTVEHYRQFSKTKAPILLHCSAGIGRTGTFCAIDIGIRRYLEKKIIDIPSIVLKMRTERAGSVQTEDQYLFAHLAMMDYIKQQQTLQERINESIKSSETDSADTVDRVNSKDTSSFSTTDDPTRKAVRLKTNGKKSISLDKTNALPIMRSDATAVHLQEPIYHRGKTLSDSSVSVVQYLTPSTTEYQTEQQQRQRSSTEHISSTPTTTGTVHHKKARK